MPLTQAEKRTWRAVQQLLKMGALEKRRNPVSGEWEFQATYTQAEEQMVLAAIRDAAPDYIDEQLIAARTGLPAEKVHVIGRMLAAGFTSAQVSVDKTSTGTSNSG